MLKKIITTTLIFSVYLFGFDYKLKPTQLSEDVWCFFGEIKPITKENGGYMSNSCYIKTDDSYILVDAGPTYKFASQAYEAMSKIEKLPVKVVINTHDHDDHWLGSGYYKEKFNAKLLGPSTIDENYKVGDHTRMFNVLTKSAMEKTKIVKLDEQIKNITNLNVGGKEVMIVPIGTKAHSSEDLFIYLPNEKILFSGDLVMNGRITSNRDGSVIGQLKALAMMNDKGWDILVPGHGFDTSKTAMDESLLYFKLLKKRVMEAIEEGIEADDVSKTVSMAEFKDKSMFDDLNPRNVFEAYVELEFYEGD